LAAESGSDDAKLKTEAQCDCVSPFRPATSAREAEAERAVVGGGSFLRLTKMLS